MRARERGTPEFVECPRPPSSNKNIQMKRHRRERRRTRPPPNVPDSTIIDNNNDIEEQLRIQRLKKNKTEVSTPSTTRLSNDDTVDPSQLVLGNYTFDPQRNAYFPTTRTTTIRHDHIDDVLTNMEPPRPFTRLLPHQCLTIPSTSTTTTSPTTLTYMLQLLHGTTQRRHLLVTHGYGPLLLHHMSIRPVRALHTDRVLFRQMRVQNENAAHIDHHVQGNRFHNHHTGSALWTRTFDMIPFQYYYHPHHSHPMRCSDAEYVSYTHPFIHGKMLRPAAFRHMAATDPECIVGCLQPTSTPPATQIRIFDYQRQTSCFMSIPLECNDFTTTQQSSSSTIHRIVLGGTASRCATMDLNRMELLVDHHRRPSFHTKSDILCIEASSSDGGSSSTSHRPGDLVFFGHRNGLVQVLDTRTDVVQRIGKLAIGHRIPQGNGNVDSVLGIQPLFRERPDQLLARGRSCWMLWDLRRMGGSGCNQSSSAAIVQNVPLFTNSNHSIPCKGMATDPMQSVVIIPFQNEQHHTTTRYGVNVWSLDTGGHLGQKIIPTPSSSPPVPPSEIELCSTISPAWSRANDADQDHYDISTTSYGLWLRLGHPDSGMHHITCDGRWTCP